MLLGKVGLSGISYYALTQWYAAALQPKGLACVIPYEGKQNDTVIILKYFSGFCDKYMDYARHGGILQTGFAAVWYPRQVLSNQYGIPGRAARGWGDDTIEGDLTEEERKANRDDVAKSTFENKYEMRKLASDLIFFVKVF